ncbi:MAG: hypothetical protein J07HX64_00655 [halophilic archaeon J07HX64]|nr:MAG: hypothetical protein J07HX64_00655 [halophilic archaeon J07HX64]
MGGSQNLKLADSTGKTKKFSLGSATKSKKTQPAAADVDSDGNTEFVYVGSDDNHLNYIDDPESNSDPRKKVLKDASGNPVKVKINTGVRSKN